MSNGITSTDYCVQLEQISARLLIREAHAIRAKPCFKKEQAAAIAKNLCTLFAELKSVYTKKVADAARVNPSTVRIDTRQSVRSFWEGKDTVIVDYPLLTHQNRRPFFESRAMAGICTRGMTTKLWSRTCTPVTRSAEVNSAPVGEIKKLAATFRRIASNSIDWMKGNLRGEIKRLGLSRPISAWGRFEIAVIGVEDERLADCFRQLRNDEVLIDDILEDKDTNDRLTYYFRQISDIQGNLHQYSPQENAENSFWFTVPTCVKVKDGYIEPREVLYLMRSVDGMGQAIGVGYDDSMSGDLVLRSSAAIANIVARWF